MQVRIASLRIISEKSIYSLLISSCDNLIVQLTDSWFHFQAQYEAFQRHRHYTSLEPSDRFSFELNRGALSNASEGDNRCFRFGSRECCIHFSCVPTTLFDQQNKDFMKLLLKLLWKVAEKTFIDQTSFSLLWIFLLLELFYCFVCLFMINDQSFNGNWLHWSEKWLRFIWNLKAN